MEKKRKGEVREKDRKSDREKKSKKQEMERNKRWRQANYCGECVRERKSV